MIATIKLKNGDSYLDDDGKLPVEDVQFPDDGSVQITVTP